jgi:mediator of RNA polymerase II transcription subunit 10
MAKQGNIENSLVEITNNLLKAGISIANGAQDSNTKLREVTTLINHLKPESTALETPHGTIELPLNLIQVVDQGINPDLLEKDQVKALVDKNQKSKGRIESLKYFREELKNQIRLNYHELEAYLE